MLWENIDLNKQEYSHILFTLEMKNFAFTIPVLGDDENGIYKMPKFSSDIEMRYGTLDLKNEEKVFKCEMSGKIIEIMNYKLLESELRKNNLLK